MGRFLDALDREVRSLCRNWQYRCLWCGHVTWACWPLARHDRCFVRQQDGSRCGGPVTCEAA